MGASFVAYIDESGDEGFVFNPDRSGSSHWFVLAAVITRKAKDLDTVKLLDAFRAALNWERKPVHFRKLKHEHRLPLVDLIAKADLRVIAVAVHKPSLEDVENFGQKSVLYRFAARYLLERVSWCCRDHHCQGEGDGSTEIIFSHRAGTSYSELTAYFQHLKMESDQGYVRIDWNVIKPEMVRAVNHEQLMGLQLADACASAVYYGVQVNPQGFNEPRYATMLKPVIFAASGKSLGYGLQLCPASAQRLIVLDPHLAWINVVYQ